MLEILSYHIINIARQLRYIILLGSRVTRTKLSPRHWRQPGTISLAAIKEAKTQDSSSARDIAAIHGELFTSSRKSGGCKRNGSTAKGISLGWQNDASGEIVGRSQGIL